MLMRLIKNSLSTMFTCLRLRHHNSRRKIETKECMCVHIFFMEEFADVFWQYDTTFVDT